MSQDVFTPYSGYGSRRTLSPDTGSTWVVVDLHGFFFFFSEVYLRRYQSDIFTNLSLSGEERCVKEPNVRRKAVVDRQVVSPTHTRVRGLPRPNYGPTRWGTVAGDDTSKRVDILPLLSSWSCVDTPLLQSTVGAYDSWTTEPSRARETPVTTRRKGKSRLDFSVDLVHGGATS